jgi:hypothetical protein
MINKRVGTRQNARMHLLGIFTCVVVAACLVSCGPSADSVSAPPSVNELAAPAEGFTLVVVPDTQCYPSNSAPYSPGSCGSNPPGSIAMMHAQMTWIVAHQTAFKIPVVVGVGDIVQDGTRDTEWQAVDSEYQVLDAANIPYIAAVGNHDYDTPNTSVGSRLTTHYNQHFGIERFSNHGWYGQSSYPAGKADNSYITFEVGSDRYLLLSLEFFARDAALEWANGVVSANPDRQVIVVTHSFLGPDGSRAVSQWNGLPSAFGITDGNNGDAMWNKFISQHSNVIAVVSGHCSGISTKYAAASREDLGLNGVKVAQMLSNYQYTSGGGSGFFRLLNIQPAKKLIAVRTYSPYLNQSMTDSANNFTIEFGTRQVTGGNGTYAPAK